MATPRVTTALDTPSCFAAAAKLSDSATFAKIRIAASTFMATTKKDEFTHYAVDRLTRCERHDYIFIKIP
jgi:hypothetical protein